MLKHSAEPSIPARLDHLARYETHLDRKLERMLAMLFELQELRRATNPT